MRLLLAGIFVLLPLTLLADIGDNLPEGMSHQKAAPSLSDSAEAGTPDGNENTFAELWPYGNPYSPLSSTNFEALSSESLYDHSWLSPSRDEPEWLNDPFGHYGIPYSPDPLGSSHGVGDPYSPDSAIDFFNQGWRMGVR